MKVTPLEKQIVRLRLAGLNVAAIAVALQIPRTRVGRVIRYFGNAFTRPDAYFAWANIERWKLLEVSAADSVTLGAVPTFVTWGGKQYLHGYLSADSPEVRGQCGAVNDRRQRRA